MTDFIILGTLPNAFHIISRFAKYELFLGNGSPKIFTAPDGSETKFGNIKWFTTFDIQRRPLPPESDKCPCAYERFINAPGINVNRLSDIPKDYYGVVGVPITFLEHDYGDWTILDINIAPRLEGGGYIFRRVFLSKNIQQDSDQTK